MARVRVVDADTDAQRLWERVVARLGHDLAAPDEPFDLVVADPVSREGFAAARRARTANPKRPLVCVSIYSDLDCVDDLAPDEYLVKPFTLAKLERALERLLPRAARAD